MKRRKLLVLTAVIAITASLLAGVAISQGVGGGHGMKILKAVLTPDQLKVLIDFKKAHKADRKAMLEKKLELINEKEALKKELKITQAQKDQLSAIIQSHLGQINGITMPLFNSSVALRTAIAAENPDKAQVLAAAQQLEIDIEKAAIFASGLAKEARAVLTPDQIAALEKFGKARDADQQQALKDMPGRVDDFFTLAGQLNITPDQIGGILAGIKASQPLFEERRAAHRAEMKAKVEKILTPAQLQIIAEAKAQHPHKGAGMHGKKLDEAIQFWTDLNLTKPQMDGLLKIAKDNKDNIIPLVNSIAAAGNLLRDDILSGSSVNIPKDASNLGVLIGNASLLAAQMVSDARQVLTSDQINLITQAVDKHDAHIQKMLVKLPDHIQNRIDLRAKLNLTADQKAAFAALREARLAKEKARIEHRLAWLNNK